MALENILMKVTICIEAHISSAGVPTARLVPIQHSPAKRQLGIDAGKILIADDFDGPSAKLAALFAGTRKSLPTKRKRKGD